MAMKTKYRVKTCKDGAPECLIRFAPSLVVRADGESDNSISGYALKWDDTYDIYGDGSLIESFERGSFKDSIENEYPIFLLRQHAGSAIASTRNDTLSLEEDKVGLAFRAEMNLENSEARDAYIMTKDGTSSGVSVGFSLRNLEYKVEGDEEDEDSDRFIITKVDRLFEISLVHTPAYESSEARSLRDLGGMNADSLHADRQTDADYEIQKEALRLRLGLIGG